MNRIVSANLWDEIEAIAEQSKTKLAAIAYVTDDSKVQFGEGDTLIVDASDAAIQTAQTSVRVLKDALKRGAELYSCTNLHAKLMVLERTVVIGSANMSQRSKNNLVEAALITDHPGTLATARSFITQLAEESVAIDEIFIRRIAKLPVEHPRKMDSAGKSKKTTIVLPESRTWLLGIHDLDLQRYEHEDELAEQGMREAEQLVEMPEQDIGWIRFTGDSKFRREARRGDQVIQIWREKVADAPEKVYRHSSIIHRLDTEKWTRFYVESYADEEKQALSWEDFLRLVQKVGLTGRIGKWTTREIDEPYSEALWSLWSQRGARKAKAAASK